MKAYKIGLLTLWVLCTVIFVIGVLTPLDFTHTMIMYVTFFISFNGIFILSFLLTDFIYIKKNKVLFGFFASVTLMLAYALSPQFGSGWRTQEILYREKDNPDNIIAFQTEDLGAFGINRRDAKIIKITPLFTFTIVLKKDRVIGDEWVRVNELVKQQ